jgi:DNA-binding transcriptional LysR family regulator
MRDLNWDDVRLFLLVLRAGSLTSGARRAGLDQSTVARRIEKLEQTLGERLLHRSPSGVHATGAGEVLAHHAERAEMEMSAASSRLEARDGDVSGVVRLATPEAFGTYLVAPAMKRFHARHPGIQLELVPQSRAVSLSKREADLAVTLQRPEQGNAIARKLTNYALGLYAARTYLETAARIDDVRQVQDHPLTWYIEEMIDVAELRCLHEATAGAETVFRSNSIVAQHGAVAGGLGLGVLHCFVADADERLVRILAPAFNLTRSYWLVCHRGDQHVPRIRAVSEFLAGLVARPGQAVE